MRAFTNTERRLLRGHAFKLRLLLSFYLDDGQYNFCDDSEDVRYGTQKYIGASGLLSCTDIKTGNGLSSESVTLTLDGMRMKRMGYDDPQQLFREIMALKLHQRRVDISYGIGFDDELNLLMRKPVYAGKINNIRLVDAKMEFGDGQMEQSTGNLEIMLDSLSSRYTRITARTRSHADQQAIDPTDMFFSFVQGLVQSTQDLYWGKEGVTGEPAGSSVAGGGGIAGAIANKVLNQ